MAREVDATEQRVLNETVAYLVDRGVVDPGDVIGVDDLARRTLYYQRSLLGARLQELGSAIVDSLPAWLQRRIR